MRLPRLALFCLFSFFVAFSSEGALLTHADIQPAMEELFEYHIDQKEITSTLLARSLALYIDQFDPSYAYLLHAEVAPYIHPTTQTLYQMMQEYQSEHYTTFFTLHDTIRSSIMRARNWRTAWEKDPVRLVQEAKCAMKDFDKNKKTYPLTLGELEKRHKARFVRLIAFHIEELSSDSYIGREDKLIALCEKQVSLMENDYLGVNEEGKPRSQKEQEHGVILHTLKALAQSLDPHTSYFSPDEAYAMKVQLEKGMCGIGVVLKEGIDGVTIQQLIKGGPAAQCGRLLAGDTICEVDGQKVEGFSFQRVLELMRGKEGTITTLGVIRNSSNSFQFLRVELIRSKIILEDKRVDVEVEPFADGVIGKITLHSFYEGDNDISSEHDLRVAIDELRALGPLYGVVLDMRENSGGFLSQAVKVGGLFISSGVVVISRYSDGDVRYYRSLEGSRFYDGPLVILVSKGSASAAEIVAAALQDYGVALIVGDEQTYGKGTIQHQTLTSGGSESLFKVTIGKYYTVSGKSTQISGVKSDILVPTSYHFEELGEKCHDYALPCDYIDPAFDDPLSDIDPIARRWFQRFYLPTLQPQEKRWTTLLPILRANSQKRLEQNFNFQLFLKEVHDSLPNKTTLDYGQNDLQMEECVNLIKDMVILSQPLESTLNKKDS